MNPYQFKPLIKRAFAPELPHSLALRTTKGNYTSDMFRGIMQNHQLINKMIQSSVLGEMGIIDQHELINCLDQFKNGLSIPLWEFNLTIAYEHWLRKWHSTKLDYWKSGGVS